MTNERDVVLQDIFNQAEQELDSGEFTRQVVKRTYGLVVRLAMLAVGLLVVSLLALLALGISPLAAVQQASQLLTVSLVQLDEGWTAFALSPVNSIGGALIIGVKAARMLHKRILG